MVVEQIDLLADFARDTGNVVRVVENEDLVVAAPPRMIAIALTNLLRNALTYSRDGVVEVTVGPESVTVTRLAALGMTAEDLQRVFEPFFRGDASQAYAASGHGLGLAIVRRLVDQFGWSLDLASETGFGTTVTLSFTGAPRRSWRANTKSQTRHGLEQFLIETPIDQPPQVVEVAAQRVAVRHLVAPQSSLQILAADDVG